MGSQISKLMNDGDVKNYFNVFLISGTIVVSLGLLNGIALLESMVHVSARKEGPIKVIKRVYNASGVSGFYRGLGLLLTLGGCRALEEKIKPVVISFPIIFIRSILHISPFELPTFRILDYNYFQFNVIDSMLSHFTLGLLSTSLCNIATELVLNTSYFKYSLNRIVIKSFIESLIVCPIACIQTQYCQYVLDSIIQRTNAPMVDTPLNVTKQFIQRYGFLRLFYAFPLVFVHRVLENQNS